MEIKNKIDWDLKFKNDCVNEIYALLNNTKWNIKVLKEQLKMLGIYFDKVDFVERKKATLLKDKDNENTFFGETLIYKLDYVVCVSERLKYLLNMVDRINFIGIVENQEFNKDKDDFVALMEKYETTIKSINQIWGNFDNKIYNNPNIDSWLGDFTNLYDSINEPIKTLQNTTQILIDIIESYEPNKEKENYDINTLKMDILGAKSNFIYRDDENNLPRVNREKYGKYPLSYENDDYELDKKYISLYNDIVGLTNEYNDYGFTYQERQALLNDLYKHFFIWKLELLDFDNSINYMSNIQLKDNVFLKGLDDDNKIYLEQSKKELLEINYNVIKDSVKRNPNFTYKQVLKDINNFDNVFNQLLEKEIKKNPNLGNQLDKNKIKKMKKFLKDNLGFGDAFDEKDESKHKS